MRLLIPIRRIVEEAEEQGEDLDSLFIDRDDVIQIDRDIEED